MTYINQRAATPWQRVRLHGGPLHGLTRHVRRNAPHWYFQHPEGERKYRYERDPEHRFVYAPKETP